MNFWLLLQTIIENLHSTKRDPETAARSSIRGKALVWGFLGIISFIIGLFVPIFIFLSIYLFYKAWKTWKKSYNEEEVNKEIKKVAHRVYRHLDWEFKKNPSLITSFPQVKGADVRYTTLSEAKKLYSGDVYLGHFALSKVMAKYAPNEIKLQAENTPLFIKKSELTKGFLVLGNGKTPLLKNLLAQSFYDRAVVVDFGGELVRALYREGKDVIFNFFDERGKIWDVFKDISRTPTLAQVVAEALVGAVSLVENAPSAVSLIREALLYATFSSGGEKYRAFLDYLNNKKDESTNRVLEPLMEVLNLLVWLEKEGVEKFSVYDFLDEKDKRLFLLLDPIHEGVLKPFVSSLLSVLISILLSRSSGNSDDFTLLLLDEFPSIKLPQGVQDGLFSSITGVQLIAAARTLSRESDDESLVWNVLNFRRYLALFPVSDPYTLEVIDNIGEVDVYIQNKVPTFHYSTTKVPKLEGFLKYITSYELQTGGMSIGESSERDKFKLISGKVFYQLPENSFVLQSNNPFSLLIARIKDVYYPQNEENPAFVERDLKDFYSSYYSSLGVVH